MIILHGQQAPVTDPPVHQTGIDGRRKRGGDALRIPVDDFRYLREGGFQEGQQIVTFRRCQPLLSVRQADNLTVSQPLRMRICLHRKEMQTSRGSRQPPGAGEQQRCPAIRQRLTKLFRKREDFHATERAAGGKPAGYGFGGDGRHINSVGPASLAQHPVAVTQNKRVKGFFFHHYRLCPGYITPPRGGAICCQLFSNARTFAVSARRRITLSGTGRLRSRAVHSLSHNACSAVISRVSSRSTGTVTLCPFSFTWSISAITRPADTPDSSRCSSGIVSMRSSTALTSCSEKEYSIPSASASISAGVQIIRFSGVSAGYCSFSILQRSSRVPYMFSPQSRKLSSSISAILNASSIRTLRRRRLIPASRSASPSYR